MNLIGHLHYGVTFLLQPESFSFFPSYFNLAVPWRFKSKKPKFAQRKDSRCCKIIFHILPIPGAM